MMAEMDKKTKVLLDAAKTVLEACRVNSMRDAIVVSLREAVVAVEYEQVGKMLLDLKAAIENKDMTVLYTNRWPESRDAFLAAIAAWNELHREGNGDD